MTTPLFGFCTPHKWIASGLLVRRYRSNSFLFSCESNAGSKLIAVAADFAQPDKADTLSGLAHGPPRSARKGIRGDAAHWERQENQYCLRHFEQVSAASQSGRAAAS